MNYIKKNMTALLKYDVMIQLIIGIILVIAVFIPRIPHLIGENIVLIFISFSAMVWLLHMIGKGAVCVKSSRLNISVLAFVLLAVISLVISRNPYNSLRGLYKIAGYAVLFFVVLNNIKDKSQIIRLIYIVMVLAIGALLFGLYEYFFGTARCLPFSLPYSVFPNPNHFAGYLVIFMCFLCGMLLFDTPSPTRRLCFLGLLMLSTLCIFFTRSRGGLLSLLISSGILFYIKDRRYFTGYIVVVSCLAIFVLGSRGLFLKIIHKGGDKHSVERVVLWKDTIRYISDYPLLGTGVNTFRDYYPQYKSMTGMRSAEFAHNEYLHTWAEMGIVAFGLFVLIVVIFIQKAFALMRQQSSAGGISKGIKAGILAGGIAVVTQSMFEFNLHSPAIAVTASVILGITGACTAPSEKQILKLRQKNIYRPIIILFLLTGIYLYRGAIAQLNWQEGNRAAQSGELLLSIDKYKRAVSMQPLNHEYHASLSKVYEELAFNEKNKDYLDKGLIQLNIAVKLYPMNVFYRRRLAYYYANYNLYDEALSEFEKVLDLAPNVEHFQQEYDILRKSNPVGNNI